MFPISSLPFSTIALLSFHFKLYLVGRSSPSLHLYIYLFISLFILLSLSLSLPPSPSLSHLPTLPSLPFPLLHAFPTLLDSSSSFLLFLAHARSYPQFTVFVCTRVISRSPANFLHRTCLGALSHAKSCDSVHSRASPTSTLVHHCARVEVA